MIASLERAAALTVSRETFGRISAYADMLIAESSKQNLISTKSIEHLWDRHILDAAQLIRFAEHRDSTWADIGAGAGLPGIVIACFDIGPVTLIEPRRLRAQFLNDVIDKLALNARVIASKAEKATGHFDMITARAVAPLTKLLEISIHLSTGKTCWVLPKGRSAQSELAEAKRTWQGTFHVEPSFTDPGSEIIVAREVTARRQ